MKKGLGRGLNSLFGDFDDDFSQELTNNAENKSDKEIVVNKPQEIEIGLIDRNNNQPRKNFDEQALNELAESIKTYGIVQPIIVNKKDNRFVIVAGERRWRAARIAGLKTVPCIVKDYSNQEISEIAIIENLQREDLNPIESARAIKNLIDEFNLTQDEVADKIGKSRPAVANTLRLLTLPENIVSLVENNKISAGHARALLSLDSSVKQKEIALKIIEKNLSVRETENLIKALSNLKPGQHKSLNNEKSLELKSFETQIKRLFSTSVSIKGNDNKGKIIIDYYTKEDLDRIFEILNRWKPVFILWFLLKILFMWKQRCFYCC